MTLLPSKLLIAIIINVPHTLNLIIYYHDNSGWRLHSRWCYIHACHHSAIKAVLHTMDRYPWCIRTGFPWAEVLEKVNMVELYSTGNVCISAGPSAVITRRMNCLDIPVSTSIWEKLHSRNITVALHISSSWCPLHTEAIPGGEIVTAPEIVIACSTLSQCKL